MFSALRLFGRLGEVFEIDQGSTTSDNAYVAEDGTTFYVAEDGTTFYVQEDAVAPFDSMLLFMM